MVAGTAENGAHASIRPRFLTLGIDPSPAWSRASELVGCALDGKLTLDEFVARKPSTPSDPFLEVVIDDIEDPVTHFPAHWPSRRPDFELWQSMPERVTLLVDGVLLSPDWADADPVDLCRLREKLLQIRGMTSSNEVRHQLIKLTGL